MNFQEQISCFSASSTQPQTQPPAGADVVDLMEQLTVEMDPVSV